MLHNGEQKTIGQFCCIICMQFETLCRQIVFSTLTGNKFVEACVLAGIQAHLLPVKLQALSHVPYISLNAYHLSVPQAEYFVLCSIVCPMSIQRYAGMFLRKKFWINLVPARPPSPFQSRSCDECEVLSGKRHQSQVLQTWSCGPVAQPRPRASCLRLCTTAHVCLTTGHGVGPAVAATACG